MRALASPASLQGRPVGGRGSDGARAQGCAARGSTPTSSRSPTAARERPRCSPRTLGGEWREAAATDPLGRPVRRAVPRARRRHGGGRVGRGDRAAAPLRGRARPAARLEPRPRRAPARGRGRDVRFDPRRSRRHGDGRRRRRTAGGRRRLADAARPPRAVRREEPAARRAGRRAGVRAAEGRRRRSRSRCSRRGSPPWARCGPTQTFRERAPPAGSAPRSPRLGGKLVSGASVVLERIDFRSQAAGADLVVTGEGTIDRSSVEGKAVGEVLRACRELDVRCERLRRPRRGAAAGHQHAPVERGSRARRRRSRGARRPARSSAARRRVGASRSSGASSRRASRCPRPAAGTPTR